MIRENLYKILGLPNFAPLEDIKKAYRILAMKHHPDRGGDEEIMKKINTAYQVLSEKKDAYDERLRGGRMPSVIIYRYTGGYGGMTTSTTTFTWNFNN